MDVASSESSPVSYETGSSNGSAARSDSVSVSGSISRSGSAKVGSIGHVRKKKWSPKVKTGCVTCRSRRIKCDEAKPSCKKCTTSGRQCEGYENPTKSTSGIQPMLPKGDELSTLLVQPNHAIAPSEVDPTPSERRMMYMFRTEAALQMAGAFNQTLWTIDLLQVTQMYPVVWHAGIALAAAYWRYNTPSEIDPSEQTKIELTKLALHQYNKAIRYAIQLAAKESPSQADQEVLLISNLMFTGICSLCGNIKNALEQFCQGLRLFNSFRLWEKIDSNQTNPHSSPLCRESLVTAFRRFAGQSISLREPNWPEWQTKQLLPEIKPTTPFVLPTEAYLEFEDIHNSLLDAAMARIYAHNKDMPQPQQDISAIFRNALEAWKARFKYLSESEPLNPTDLEAIIILKMRLLSLEVTLTSGFSKMEMMWDMHNAKFAKIVALGERLCHVRGIKSESASASQPALFSFTASICEPLYQTARFCRHSSSRHRALNILRRIPMNEGIFTTTILADVAEAVINIEEGAVAAGLPSSNCDCVVADRICEDHRVSDCHMTFPNHQEGHIRLRTNGEVTHRLPVRTVYLQC